MGQSDSKPKQAALAQPEKPWNFDPLLYWVYLLIFSLALGGILAIWLVWQPQTNGQKGAKIIAVVTAAGLFIGTFCLWLKIAYANSWCRKREYYDS